MEDTIQFPRKLDEKGYVQINVDGCWIQEHRFVIEEYILRLLDKREVIHHIDGNKQNNTVDNLMIFPSQKEHQKFHLKIKQFGYTNPVKDKIKNRWIGYIN